jgi:hypothetical protein
MRRSGGRSRQLGDAVGDAEIVAFGILDGYPRKLVVPGETLGVGVRRRVCTNFRPGILTTNDRLRVADIVVDTRPCRRRA